MFKNLNFVLEPFQGFEFSYTHNGEGLQTKKMIAILKAMLPGAKFHSKAGAKEIDGNIFNLNHDDAFEDLVEILAKKILDQIESYESVNWQLAVEFKNVN